MTAGALQATLESIPTWIWWAVAAAAALFSLGVTIRIAAPRGAWGRKLRSRFLFGVPWGTLLTVAGVLAVYLFLQGGYRHPYDPLVIPFRAWSYFYPLGILTAPFTHASMGHVTGNLLGTLTFAPVVEYAVGHFPRRCGSQSFAGLRNNPFVRILAVPVGAVVVGVLTGLFSFGPVIGFSGVVFAFAGFALVSAPLLTIVALVAGRVLDLLYRTIVDPLTITGISTSVSPPWWANIAIQGHLLGFLFGVALGGLVAYRRDSLPSPGRLWVGTLLFAVAQSLWAWYTPLGNGWFVLFTAIGTAIVFLLAVLVTAAVTTPRDRTIVGLIDLTSRELAVMVFCAVVVAFALVGGLTNLVVLADGSMAGVEAGDYTVTYAEDVPNRYAAGLLLPFVGDGAAINTSGVIVASEQRQVFQTVVSKPRLANDGRATVVVGGVGWRETVVANRTGWNPVGNESVYTVSVKLDGGDPRTTFTSNASTAQPRVRNRRVRLGFENDSFTLAVLRGNRTIARAPIPGPNSNRSLGGLTFNRTGRDLFAVANGTRVRVARRR